MRLDFSGTFARANLLLSGALLTVELAAAAMVIGLVIALVCARLQLAYPRSAGRLVTVYVELIRNTPFLVQIFIVRTGNGACSNSARNSLSGAIVSRPLEA